MCARLLVGSWPDHRWINSWKVRRPKPVPRPQSNISSGQTPEVCAVGLIVHTWLLEIAVVITHSAVKQCGMPLSVRPARHFRPKATDKEAAILRNQSLHKINLPRFHSKAFYPNRPSAPNSFSQRNYLWLLHRPAAQLRPQMLPKRNLHRAISTMPFANPLA